jgi:succinate dehydrogenase / fumarate reductase cytochrome b subunit
MNWKDYFSTSIGKKLQMSLTGIFLITFLLVHCYINAQIFYNDKGVRFSEAAHFMGTNFVIRTVEIGLFAFLILHVVQGLLLWFKNRARRSVGYAVSAGNKTSPWYSRSMALLGTLILMFLILHLSKFWGPNRASMLTGAGELNLYNMMKVEFQETWVVIVYLLGVIALGWHLLHGFYSAFQTLGLGTHRYKGIIKGIGVAFSIIVPLVFAMMPIAFYMQWLS